MKGSGGGYGFDGISDIGRAIEAAAKEESSDAISKELERLSFYLDNVEITHE